MASRCPAAGQRAGLSGIPRPGVGMPSASSMTRPQSSPSPTGSSCPGVSAASRIPRPAGPAGPPTGMSSPRGSPLRIPGPTRPPPATPFQTESYSQRVKSLTGPPARRPPTGAGASEGVCPAAASAAASSTVPAVSATSMASQPSEPLMTSTPQRSRLPTPTARGKPPYPALPAPPARGGSPYPAPPPPAAQAKSPYPALPPPAAQAKSPYPALPPPAAQARPPYPALPPPATQAKSPYPALPPPPAQSRPPYPALPPSAGQAGSPYPALPAPPAQARPPYPATPQRPAAAPAAAAPPSANVTAPPRFASRTYAAATSPAQGPAKPLAICPAAASAASRDPFSRFKEAPSGPMLEDEEPPWYMDDSEYDLDDGDEMEDDDLLDESTPWPEDDSQALSTPPPSPAAPPPSPGPPPQPVRYSTPAAVVPSSCPANPRCNRTGGETSAVAETSGGAGEPSVPDSAADIIIENLRCQEEHEVSSLIRNLADLQNFRRQALSHALPNTPFLQEPAQPEQLVSKLAAKALEEAPVATSTPRGSAAPAATPFLDLDPRPGTRPATAPGAPLHGAYSQEIFDMVRM